MFDAGFGIEFGWLKYLLLILSFSNNFLRIHKLRTGATTLLFLKRRLPRYYNYR